MKNNTVIGFLILIGCFIVYMAFKRPPDHTPELTRIEQAIIALQLKQDSVFTEIKKWQKPDTTLINNHFQTIINEEANIIKTNSVDADVAFFKWHFEQSE